MDFLSKSILLETPYNTISDIQNRYEESYLSETYDFLMQIETEFNEAKIDFYRIVAENASNLQIVEESFREVLDNKIIPIFQKMLAYIIDLIDRFLKYITFNRIANKIPSDDRYHKMAQFIRHKNFFNSVHFVHRGFIYTPDNVDTYSGTNISFIVEDPYDLFKNGNIVTMKRDTAVVDNSYVLDDDYYDMIRGKIVKSANKQLITAEEYRSELFKALRNNSDKKEDIIIDGNNIRRYIYNGDIAIISSAIDDANADKKNATKFYKGIIKELKHVKLDSISDPIVARKYQAYLHAMVNRAQKLSSIVSIAYSSKIHSYRECFIDCRQVYAELVAIYIRSYKNQKR